MNDAAPPPRAIIERAIDALIDLLDMVDGDCDREPEEDVGGEEAGEPCGATLLYSGA